MFLVVEEHYFLLSRKNQKKSSRKPEVKLCGLSNKLLKNKKTQKYTQKRIERTQNKSWGGEKLDIIFPKE